MKTKRFIRTTTVLIAAAAIVKIASAQDSATSHDPGWTGLTNPMDVIAARQALMLELEQLMVPIDTYTVEPDTDPTLLPPAARTIATMLLAVPHLFPSTTNLYDPEEEMPATIALPRIWEEFDTFYSMAAASSMAATTMAGTTGPEALRASSLALRATCDACHALYLRPYVSGTVTEEDLEFDFDSIFENN